MNLFNSILRRINGRLDFSSSRFELLYEVLERLKTHAPPRPRQHNNSMRLMQVDVIVGDLLPLAVAIVALKKASISPAYLVGKEFEQLCERAADDMATVHAQASAVFTKMLPQLPGLEITAGHGQEDASKLAAKKILSALDQICSGRSLLPAETALLNLTNLMGERLKINRFEAVKLYESL